MQLPRVLIVIGTRPEAIKMAPVLKELRRRSEQFYVQCCVTAQHREMLDQVLKIFQIVPDYDLDLMIPDQTLPSLISDMISRLDPVLKSAKPDWVLVQGDTATAMVAAQLAFLNRICVGHVEAGLRTYDKFHPFPEEAFRRTISVFASLHFAPTNLARQNLLAEAVSPEAIYITGNTVVDALLEVANMPYDWSKGPLGLLPTDRDLILVTTHRRENFGTGIQDICGAVRDLANIYRKSVQIVFPVHRNPHIHDPVYAALSDLPNVTLLEPIDYLSLVHLMKRSRLILTDSGGLQEEAPTWGVPVLVLREQTERQEALEAGTARLVGTNRPRIVEETCQILNNPANYPELQSTGNPFGDGHAAERIAEALIEGAGYKGARACDGTK
jgi:UDP-N-acetylglucosamine 2-epimerase (non-hydrolysing)